MTDVGPDAIGAGTTATTGSAPAARADAGWEALVRSLRGRLLLGALLVVVLSALTSLAFADLLGEGGIDSDVVSMFLVQLLRWGSWALLAWPIVAFARWSWTRLGPWPVAFALQLVLAPAVIWLQAEAHGRLVDALELRPFPSDSRRPGRGDGRFGPRRAQPGELGSGAAERDPGSRSGPLPAGAGPLQRPPFDGPGGPDDRGAPGGTLGPAGPDGPPGPGGPGGPGGPRGEAGRAPPWRRGDLWFRGALIYGGVLALGVSLDGFLRRRDEERRAARLELRAARLERELTQARLESLSSQVQPHFLLNSLHSVGGLVREGRSDDALASLSALGDLLRSSLEPGARQEVTLAHELGALRGYLAIESIRMGERLRSELRIGEGCEHALLPPLVLLPLVENAVRHAAEKRVEPTTLALRAERHGERLTVVVEDDGPGFPTRVLALGSASYDDDRPHIGLSNTRSRLLGLYGERGSFRLENRPEGGARVTVEVPWHTDHERDPDDDD